MQARLKAVRDASGHRGAGMVVVVLQDGEAAPLPQDRVTGICNGVGLDPKCVRG